MLTIVAALPRRKARPRACRRLARSEPRAYRSSRRPGLVMADEISRAALQVEAVGQVSDQLHGHSRSAARTRGRYFRPGSIADRLTKFRLAASRRNGRRTRPNPCQTRIARTRSLQVWHPPWSERTPRPHRAQSSREPRRAPAMMGLLHPFSDAVAQSQVGTTSACQQMCPGSG